MQESKQKVWFVTGSSRGLGRDIVKAALAGGDVVAATARDPKALDNLKTEFGDRILPIALDVTNSELVKQGLAAAVEVFGRLDVVVNNAGYGFFGALEEMTDEQFRGQIDTNFWGVVHVTRAAIPILRVQGAGHIIQITSIGGRAANPGLSGYQAAKFAVEGFSESVAQEIKPLGINLTIVEPGGFNTDWGGSSMSYADSMPAYAPTVGAMGGFLKAYEGQALGDPKKGAQAIFDLTRYPEPPLRLPLGSDAYTLLKVTYQGSLKELEALESVTRSTDRDDLPPFDGDALLKMIGRG